MSEREPDAILSSSKERIAQHDQIFSYNQLTPEVVSGVVDDVLVAVDVIVESMTTAPDLTASGTIGLLNEIEVQYGIAAQITAMEDLHPDELVRQAARDAKQRYTHHQTETAANELIHATIVAFASTPEAQSLSGEDARYLIGELESYRRMGLELSVADRQRLTEMKHQVAQLIAQFRKNISEYEPPVSPSDMPIFKQPDRGLRRDAHASVRLALANVNPPLIESIVRLRHEMATLLGYESWAQYQLENRMAQTPEAVYDHYAQIIEPLTEKAHKEIAIMTEMLQADGYEPPLQRYDTGYYGNKIREQSYSINGAEVAEYLPIGGVLHGFFEIAQQTFGLRIRKIDDAAAWDETVESYAIDDCATGRQISQFFLDLYPREGKCKHIAARTMVQGYDLADGTYNMPQSVLIANFASPKVENDELLLSHSNAVDLFHELGHVLHQTLTTAKYIRFAGTHVERDFVEAPSKIQENWMWEPAILTRIAKHYKTSESMPRDLIDRLIAARDVNGAIKELGQVACGLYDMALHDGSHSQLAKEVWRQASAVTPLPLLDDDFLFACFGHPITSYDAAYFGYEWSSGHGADAYSRFQTEGVTNPAVGADWRRIVLESGGTTNAMDKMREFLGREPRSGEAFARTLGIVTRNTRT